MKNRRKSIVANTHRSHASNERNSKMGFDLIPTQTLTLTYEFMRLIGQMAFVIIRPTAYDRICQSFPTILCRLLELSDGLFIHGLKLRCCSLFEFVFLSVPFFCRFDVEREIMETANIQTQSDDGLFVLFRMTQQTSSRV